MTNRALDDPRVQAYLENMIDSEVTFTEIFNWRDARMKKNLMKVLNDIPIITKSVRRCLQCAGRYHKKCDFDVCLKCKHPGHYRSECKSSRPKCGVCDCLGRIF